MGFWDGVEREDFFESLALNIVIIPQGTGYPVSDARNAFPRACPSLCADRYECPGAVALETCHLGQGDGSVGSAVLIGAVGSLGFGAHRGNARLVAPGTTVACLGA